MNDLYKFSARTLAGENLDLKDYRGKVVLVVNTASECGLTPQYTGLEALHKKYHDKGVAVLGFPCNQFGAQEPGDAAAHPLYQWLTQAAQGAKGPAIEWNFAKFLIGRDGRVVKRYAPQTEPKDLAGDIEELLAA